VRVGIFFGVFLGICSASVSAQSDRSKLGPITASIIEAVENQDELSFGRAWSSILYRMDRMADPIEKIEVKSIFFSLSGCSIKSQTEPDPSAKSKLDGEGSIWWVCEGYPAPDNNCDDIGFGLSLTQTDRGIRYAILGRANSFSKKRCPGELPMKEPTRGD
jgi:hypothetical protein